MQEAWIRLTCPDCQVHWEANLTDIPEPGDSFGCPDCGVEHRVSEFAKTARDLEILRDFHGI